MPSNGPELNVLNVVLAAVPIAILIVTMLVSALKWSAPKAGAVSWLAAAGLALLVFGADERVLAIGSSKGLSLSLFVLTIIWTSVMLYNVIEGINGITVIGRTITGLVRDPLAQALVVGWAFAGLIQGVAGFGLPIAVVAPFMVMIGFRPSTAVAITLVGHAWAVTFGSLGSSYYTIQLVSGLDERELGVQMAAMFVLPTILTGFAVAHLQGGFASIRRGAPAIVVMGAAMSLGLWITAFLGAYQIASVVGGLIGCVVGWWISRLPILGLRSQDDDAPSSTEQPAEKPAGIGFHTAFLPYYLLFGLSLISQLPPVRELGSSLYFGLDYPSTETGLGFTVDGQEGYAKIKLLNHPAPLIVSLAVDRIRRIPGTRTLETGYPPFCGTQDLRTGHLEQRRGRDDGDDGAGDDGHGHDCPARLGNREGHGDAIPDILAVHRCTGDLHDRQQHQLQRHVRRASSRNGRGTGHRSCNHRGHAVYRRLPGLVRRHVEGDGRHCCRRTGWTRARRADEDDPLLPGPGLGGRIAGVGHHQSFGRQVVFAKSKVQQIALWVMAADFPLLYLGAVTFENTAVTAIALVVMAAAAVAAGIVF